MAISVENELRLKLWHYISFLALLHIDSAPVSDSRWCFTTFFCDVIFTRANNIPDPMLYNVVSESRWCLHNALHSLFWIKSLIQFYCLMRIKWKKLNMKLNVTAMINFQTRWKYAYNVSNYSTKFSEQIKAKAKWPTFSKIMLWC